MKILITTDWYSPAVNGVVTSVLNLKKQLEEQGHEVRVLTLAQAGKDGAKYGICPFRQEGNVWYLSSFGVGRIYPGARLLAGSSRGTVREMVDWKPDVVHSQCEFVTFGLAKRIAKKTGARFLHTYHTVYEDYTHYFSPSRAFGRKQAAWFSRQVLKSVDGVIVPTEKVKNLLESYGVVKPIFTVPTGIDCDRFAAAHLEAGSKAMDAPSLVSVGRLAKEKNLEEIVSWLACPRGQQYSWLIVGDGPCREALENQVKRLGLEERVFFAGMVKPEQVARWYQKGRVFVSASESETQGLTYLEALAGGIPAVCRKDPCLDGVIENGRNGWQYRNKTEFFDALEKLAYPGAYYEMSRQAQVMAAKFDQKIFGKRVLEAYLSVRAEEVPALSLLTMAMRKTM